MEKTQTTKAEKPSKRLSLNTRFSVGVAVGLLATFSIGVFVLIKFRTYQEHSTAMLTGQEKTVVLGHLVETRIKAAQELVQLSVTSQSANESFLEKVKGIDTDLKTLINEKSDPALDEARKALSAIAQPAKTEALEDLFVHYRNVKATAFNIYRFAWGNKWMNVARTIGLVHQDLENLPYHAADKAAAVVEPRITGLTTLVGRSELTQMQKMAVFSQLNQLKSVMDRYTAALEHSDQLRDAREQALKKTYGLLKSFNENQSKVAVQFASKSQQEYVKAILAVAVGALFSLIWFFWVTKRHASRLNAAVRDLTTQAGQWILAGGQLTNQAMRPAKDVGMEFEGIYDSLNKNLQRLSVLRREDHVVKRTLHTPYILVNRARQAVHWNSALSILLKARSVDETGPAHYSNLIRMPVQKGKVAVDPIEKTFSEKVEVSRLLELIAGAEQVPVKITCTPVFGADQEIEYVLIQILDLKEEFKRVDNELRRQLETVKGAVLKIKDHEIPGDAPPDSRPAVADCISALKTLAIELQNHRELMQGQLSTALERVSREGALKKSVYGRLAQVVGDIENFHLMLKKLDDGINAMTLFLRDSAARDSKIKHEYTVLKKKGGDLQKNIRLEQDLAARCLKSLQKIDSLTQGIRSREQLIYSALEKATIANANNSILRSRQDVSMEEISNILDSVNILAEQFERGYRFIQQAVTELETQYYSLKEGLQESLATSNRLSQDDKGIINVLGSLEKLSSESKDDFKNILQNFYELKSSIASLESNLGVAEEKCRKLVQVGTASLELQTHLERGFKGMLEGNA